MNFKPIIFLFILIPLNILSQDFWEKINIPENQSFSSITVGDFNDLFLGNLKSNDTGGVFMTNNGGNTWSLIGLENYSIYSLSLNHEGNLLAGTQTGIFLYDFNTKSWDQKFASIPNIITINPGLSNAIFAGGNILLSNDDGYTWQEILDPGEDDPYSFVALSIDTIYLGAINFLGGGGVFRSVDGGETWENIGLENHFIASLGINSSGDLFAGGVGQYDFGWGGLYKLPSNTSTWDTLFYWPRITSMVITEADIIYCGYWTGTEGWGGVMHSEDNGETWNIDSTGMGNIGISSLVLDKNETLYALSSTTERKLFRSILPVNIKYSFKNKNQLRTFCYPNPFKSGTFISFQKLNNNSEHLTLTIYSYSGKFILSNDFNKNEINQQKIFFKRGNLNSGMYIYTISCENYTCSGKFIIIN